MHEFLKQNRPGGPLENRPHQVDGKWYDVFGNEINEQEALDLEYARRFWTGQPDGMREVMMEGIEVAAEKHGQLGVFVSPTGISEKDKEKISAYRVLAKEIGYEVGQFQFQSNAHTAIASIKKIE